MQKFDPTGMEQLMTASGFQFSAPPKRDIKASEYTICGLSIDCSTSVSSFKKELEQIAQTAVDACQKSPRSENLMFRVTTFNDDVSELHGFKLLNTIKPADYNGSLNPSGWTALYDSVYEGLEAMEAQAKMLAKNDCNTNGILFVGTDGEDNRSKYSPKQIKDLIERIRHEEILESIQIVLIGITNGNTGLNQYLENFKNEAGITQYINVHEITPQNVAKLAAFVSKSISSTSQSFGKQVVAVPCVI